MVQIHLTEFFIQSIAERQDVRRKETSEGSDVANGSQQGNKSAVPTHPCTMGKGHTKKALPRMPEKVFALTQGDPVDVDQSNR